MLRPVDLLVLLGILRATGSRWSVRSLAETLQMPPAAVQRSLARLDATPVFDAGRRRVNLTAADELLVHAIPYIAPSRLGPTTRGVPTAWAVAPLSREIAAGDLPPVWPDALGEVRGQAVEPLHESAPRAARRDPGLYELLALVDAIRVGDARARGLAAGLLHARLSEVRV